MSNQDREQALLKAGAQLNGLEWPRLEDEEDVPLRAVEIGQIDRFTIFVSPLNDIRARWLQEQWPTVDPLAAMMCWEDSPGLTERIPALGTVIPKPAPVEAETSTAAPAPAGVFAMASTTHKLGGWGA